VAFEKTDHYFMADARNVYRAPLFAGPTLGHADPAGALFVKLALPVPEELHNHAAVLVGPDLFPGLAHNNGGLSPMYQRFPRHAGRPERHAIGNCLKRIRVLERILRTRAVAGIPAVLLQCDQAVGLIGFIAEVLLEGKLVAAFEPHAVAVAAYGDQRHFALLQPDSGVFIAVGLGLILAGIIIELALLQA